MVIEIYSLCSADQTASRRQPHSIFVADRLEKWRPKAACFQSKLFDASINITRTTENLFTEGHSFWISKSNLGTFESWGKTEDVLPFKALIKTMNKLQCMTMHYTSLW